MHIDRIKIDSQVLRGNPLGDPHVRDLLVQLPPGYDDGDRRYPTVYVLQGYTGQVAMWENRTAWVPTFPERVDLLLRNPDVPPVIVVYVDAWTRFGGSQFVDSPGTGAYHSYLCDEVVPLVDARYRTLDAAEHRGVAGKSSGGFGAMITPMLRPDLFGGFATHAGDALFEASYLAFFPNVVKALRDSYDGSYDRFLASFFTERTPMTRPGDDDLIENYGCAAAFSADPDGTVRLPFDLATGRVVDEVWQRWLAWDPVRMVADHADALSGMRAIWVDAGRSDEWNLDLGARAFVDALADVGITDVAFEIFDGGHGGIGHRYPLALRFLAERLSP